MIKTLILILIIQLLITIDALVYQVKKRSYSRFSTFLSNQQNSMLNFNKKQFESFSKNQVGKWIGVHTGYDPQDEMVADHM